VAAHVTLYSAVLTDLARSMVLTTVATYW